MHELPVTRSIAELHGAWIAEDEKLMWCSWDTGDLEALQAAFDEMNGQSGLESELTVVRALYFAIWLPFPIHGGGQYG